MNKLIKSAMMMASVGAMLCIVGCGAKAPDQVAIDVLKAFQKGEADTAFLAKNCTDETVALLASFGGMLKHKIKDATLSVSQAYIDDDKATVMIKQIGGEDSGEHPFFLKEIDGQWKLQLVKNAGKDMISKKTALKLLQTLKNDVLLAFNEQELNKKATPEFVTNMKKEMGPAARAKMTENEKKKFDEFVDEFVNATYTLEGSEIDEHCPESGFVEFKNSLADDGRKYLKIEVKRINGIWMLNGVQ